MPNSYNGFPVTQDQSLLKTLPGISGKVRAGHIWTIFDWLVQQYNARVETINAKDSWGYSYRKVRGGSSSWSNHASGTAVDFNATRHPFKTAGTMTAKQRQVCHQLMAESGQVLKWLEDYDEMHWEIRRGTTDAQLRKLAEKITGKKILPTGPKGTLWKGNSKVPPSVGTRVEAVQKRLRAMGYPTVVDGVYGDDTARDVADFQRRRGFTGKDLDGQWGPKTGDESLKARSEGWTINPPPAEPEPEPPAPEPEDTTGVCKP